MHRGKWRYILSLNTGVAQLIGDSPARSAYHALSFDLKKNYRTLAARVYASDRMSASRKKLFRGGRFNLVIRLNNKVANIGRQIFDVADVLHRRVQVEEDRLIIWIDRIKRFICGHERIDFCSGLFHLLSVSQNHYSNRITHRPDDKAERDKSRRELRPAARPLQRVCRADHRQHPARWNNRRHAVSGDSAGNQVDAHEWYCDSPR